MRTLTLGLLASFPLALAACPSVPIKPADEVLEHPAPPPVAEPGAELDALAPEAPLDPLPDGAALRLGTGPMGHAHDPKDVALTADGQRLYSVGTYDARPTLWDVATGRRLAVLPGAEPGGLEEIALAPDGKSLAMAFGEAVIVTDPDGTHERLRVKGQDIVAVAWSPDGARLAIGQRGGKVDLVDAATGKRQRALRAGDNMFDVVAFSQDGARVAATGSPDGKTLVWDAASGKTLLAWSSKELGYGRALAWLPDGTLIVGLSEGGNVIALAPGAKTPTPPWSAGPSLSTLTATDDGKLVVGQFGGRVAIVEPATGALVRELVPANPDQAEGGGYADCLAVAGGRVAIGWSTGKVTALELDGRPATPVAAGHQAAVNAVAWSSDGRWVASGDASGTTLLWRAKNGRLWRTLRPTSADPKWALGAPVRDVALQPGGALVAVAHDDGHVRVWDAATGEPVKDLTGTATPTALAFAPDGATLAIGHANGDVFVLDAATWQVAFVAHHPSAVLGLAFVGGPGKIAAALEHDLALWDVAGKKLAGQRARKGLRPMMDALAVSADGATALTGGFGGVVDRWDLRLAEEAKPAASYVPGDPDNVAADPVSAIAIASNGAFASGGLHAEVALFAADGTRTARRLGHRDEIRDLAFSPDGALVVSASKDGTLLVWRRE